LKAQFGFEAAGNEDFGIDPRSIHSGTQPRASVGFEAAEDRTDPWSIFDGTHPRAPEGPVCPWSDDFGDGALFDTYGDPSQGPMGDARMVLKRPKTTISGIYPWFISDRSELVHPVWL
jgi:hypothetical protein